MVTKVVIIFPADPLGPKIGGIETFQRDFIRYSPPDIKIDYIGISSDPVRRPPGRWIRLALGSREFNFFPLFYERDANKRRFIPLTLRFSLALKRSRLKLGQAVIFFNNIESILFFIKYDNPKVCVIHHDPQQQIILGKSESRWSKIPFLYLWYEKKIFSALECMYVVGTRALTFYRSKYPGQTSKFEGIPLWVDSEIFSPADTSKISIREKMLSLNKALPIHDKWILFAGRLQKVKAPLRLLDAFAEYHKTNGDASLIFVGDGNMKADIDNRVKRLSMENKVFLVGEVSAQILADFYRTADVFLLVSDSETGPRCVLEALRCGLPVVSTNVGESHRLIQNDFSGEVVNSFEPKDIARAIDKVLHHPAVYTKENCLKSIEDYAPQDGLIYDRMRKLYEQRYGKDKRNHFIAD